MACPYFFPQARLEGKSKHPRLPLGDPYHGLCRVDPMHEWRPDEATLVKCCNVGYARGTCPRFPKKSGPDATRFSITGDESGMLKIFYVCEENRTTQEHGDLKYSTTLGRFVNGHGNALLAKQAEAYVESYLRRKQEPEHAARNPHRR